MKQKVIDRVKELLGEGKIQGFLGLREQNGHIQPHLFTKPEELEDLSLGDKNKPGDARYPLNMMLIHLAQSYPDATFAVLVRGCDERGLIELYKWNQLQEERVIPIGIACGAELAQACSCSKPYPDQCVAGEKTEGVAGNPRVQEIDSMTVEDRFRYWMAQFDRCIKCYGCRNICPMCFCKECSLEEPELIQKGELPTENPIFHLTRAIHMIGRCIDCGLCEEACPADIPLRTLYKKVADIIAVDTGFRVGENRHEKCPMNVLGAS
ncbi:4Fe-4S dicluster domain-containing protein [Desulforhabdus amnigena]|jgi:ferredoxin|uniref:4Fe-4S ferredoxin n=1 Tax=Desulforhabdus amnigena TaxID=40218 RepID=A0A9W6L934_9BACT|nr:4Fe-4S binding protein [Desulforhabdus amnigena]NLJ28731.1 4Fe-4S binding protein [Deltaproteobacteria bacterium]GLI34920.1 4Fe-4S ferredoxin [Desulforhabdus amnigena]